MYQNVFTPMVLTKNMNYIGRLSQEKVNRQNAEKRMTGR